MRSHAIGVAPLIRRTRMRRLRRNDSQTPKARPARTNDAEFRQPGRSSFLSFFSHGANAIKKEEAA